MPQKNFTEAREHLQTLFNYTFKDQNLLLEALHAGGPISINGRWVSEGNKRLAVVGDAAIGVCLAHNSYHAGYAKGGIDNRRQAVLCNANLDQKGRPKGIDSCISCNPGTRPSEYMVATAVEAILGAMFEDSSQDLSVVKKGMAALGLLDA